MNAHIPMESKYGSLDILLKEISERDTVKWEDELFSQIFCLLSIGE